MMGREVVVLGSGGHAKVIIGALRSVGDVPVAIYDDSSEKLGQEVMGVPIVGPIKDAPNSGKAGVIAIGNNRIRERISIDLDMEWATVVHKAAWVDPTVEIGEGTVVFAGAVIQAAAKIGRHVVINTCASVDHDSVLTDFVQLAPGVHTGGNVVIHIGAFVGVGASIIHGKTIGSWSIVGAGAAVIRDVPAETMVVGVPAKSLMG